MSSNNTLYIVTYLSERREFEYIKEATSFAEQISEDLEVNTYVWVVENGVQEDEPFLSCEWYI